MNTSERIELVNGMIRWETPIGLLHREDGPAVIHSNGSCAWCRYGQLHREDGPAVIHSDGYARYWLDGIEYDPVTFLIKSYEYQK